MRDGAQWAPSKLGTLSVSVGADVGTAERQSNRRRSSSMIDSRAR